MYKKYSFKSIIFNLKENCVILANEFGVELNSFFVLYDPLVFLCNLWNTSCRQGGI